MNKHLTKYMLAALIVAATATSAAGASIRSEGTNIIISGDIALKQQGLNVGIQVIGPFDEAVDDVAEALRKDIETATALDKTYYTQVMTQKGGEYSFTVPGIVQGKFYGIAISEPDSELITESLYIAEESMIAEVLYAVNAAQSTSDIKAVFDNEKYHDMLIENYTILNEITSDTSLQKVYQLILEERGGGYNSFAELEAKIQSSAAVVRTAEETDKEKALSYAKYIDLSSCEDGLYTKYDDSDQNTKQRIIERIMKQKPDNEKEYLNFFEESCFLQMINDEEYAGNVSAILKNYEDKFNLDLTEYTKVESLVNKKIRGKDYSSMTEFKESLEREVNSAEDSGTGGGSGGSSGGGISGGTSSNPAVNIPEQNDVGVNLLNFDDLDSVQWAKDAIEELADRGIVSGKSERMFYPSDLITREEFVKIVVCAFDLQNDAATADFDDLDKNAWSYPYVASGVAAGLIQGIDENNFGTGRYITRQDIAAIIYRYMQSQDMQTAENSSLFADDEYISDYAREAVYALKSEGILSGTGKNYFEPKRNATRAEAAKIIATILGI